MAWYTPSPALVAAVLGYLALNFGLNYYNSWLLGGGEGQRGINLPTFYTSCHQVFIMIMVGVWCLLVPSMRWNVVSRFCDNWFLLSFVGAVNAISIGLNNASFGYISLTVNSIFKACTPFPTVLLSLIIEGKTYSFTILSLIHI